MTRNKQEQTGADLELCRAVLHERLIRIFDADPLDQQPRVIVDIACRGGELLAETYAAIAANTRRGGNLERFPLTLYGLCRDQHELAQAETDLGNLPCQARLGDPSQSNSLSTLLADAGVGEGEAVLFLCQDLAASMSIPSEAAPNAEKDVSGPLHADLLSQIGQVLRNLAELPVRPHVIALENHRLRAASGEQSAVTETQADVIPAEAFIKLAAGEGLFNDNPPARYPACSSTCEVTLNSFAKRKYRVRLASLNDLDRLCELEHLCWHHTRTPQSRIRSRLENYPSGQFVLECDQRVLGVIYSQRINNADALQGRQADNVHELHDESGPVIQLLAVNIDPEVQNLGYGDQLLEFMLQRCSLVDSVKQVVGVTLCKKFNAAAGQAFEHYILRQGLEQDPVLAFHQSHGAAIVKPVPGYRPEDSANQCSGVLVAYDIHKRVPLRGRKDDTTDDSRIPVRSETEAVLAMTEKQIREFVRNSIVNLLGNGVKAFEPDRPLMEMGLDSADLLTLQRQIENKFNLKLKPGFFFEFNTAAYVTAYISASMEGAQGWRDYAAANAVSDTENNPVYGKRDGYGNGPDPEISDTDIAIVGVSCRLPGGIDTLEKLWKTLVDAECVISEFPRSRAKWPANAEYPGIGFGGFVADADAFDASFFRISPKEARITDPQQRFLMELAWACLEDAAILPSSIKGSNTGVFIGASNCDYSRLIQDSGTEIEAHHAIGNSLSVLANRISYFLDLCGPSMLLDTACSSSLVALHTALQSLRRGECSSAFVGGTNFICHPDLSLAYHKAGMLAPDGRCKVFDADANGYVRAEGAAMLLLKPLKQALADEDKIYAVLKGSAVNHGGLAGGLTVPNPRKQSELLCAAWKDAGVSPAQLSYIEAHGTGTSLGDPIEVQGIRTAYSFTGNENDALVENSCSVGSIKSNLGHLESAAGITGLLKVIVSMLHRQLPPSVNFRGLNPKIQFGGSPFCVQDKLAPWEVSGRRIAGVSSFGSGGANAHVVVAEWVVAEWNGVAQANRPNVARQRATYLVPLSAKTGEQLRQRAGDLHAYIESARATVDLDSIAYTLQVGREAMNERLAVVAVSVDDLLQKLRAFVDNDTLTTDVYQARADEDNEALSLLSADEDFEGTIDKWVTNGKLGHLANFWTQGLPFDWHKLYGERERPRRVSLPTYPFARDRYWIESDTSTLRTPTQRSSEKADFLHPLLHRNTSDFAGQNYSSVFTGNEPFLRDHQVNGRKILPAVAYLEMARSAAEQALGLTGKPGLIRISNTVWLKPLTVDDRADINIALFPLASDSDTVETIEFEIYAGTDEPYCQGRVDIQALPSVPTIDIYAMLAQPEKHSFGSETLYATLENMGFAYGPAHRAIDRFYRDGEEVFVHLVLPGQEQIDAYHMHPSMLDGVFQACVAASIDFNQVPEQPLLPFSLESLQIFSACKAQMYALIRPKGSDRAFSGVQKNKLAKFDVDLCDTEGNVCVAARGLSIRALGDKRNVASQDMSRVFVAPVWETARAMPGPRDSAQHHVILSGLPATSVSQIESSIPGCHCVQLHPTRQDSAEGFSNLARDCFEYVQGLLTSKQRGKVLVQLVIAGNDSQPFGLGLSGLLKTAGLENPNLQGQLIAVDDAATLSLAEKLQADKASIDDEIIRYRNEKREVLRWRELELQNAPAQIAFKDRGVYLITGGLGGLGKIFANEIAGQSSNATIILTGRGPLTEEKQATLNRIAASGARLEYYPLDLADPEQVRKLIATINDRHQSLNGILHCAGMISDNFMLRKTSAEFEQVLSPKVAGTVNLDEASRHLELDFLVLFSSVVSMLGNLGQADYAVANGFMDWFSAYRNELAARGKRNGLTVSINWPLWQDGGMRLNPQEIGTFEDTTGTWPMRTSTGLEAFYRLLQSQQASAGVLEGDRKKIHEKWFVPRQAASNIETTAVGPVVEATVAPAAGPGPENLVERTQTFLCRQFASVLKLPAHKIVPQEALELYGIDSIMAMSLTRKLEESFGPLPKTLFFEYQTIAGLAEYLAESYPEKIAALVPGDSEKGSSSRDSAPASSPTQNVLPAIPEVGKKVRHRRFLSRDGFANEAQADPIAIVGLSGKYPQADNMQAYWRNLRDGKDCIVEVPGERWDWREYYSADRTLSDRHYSKWGGFINGVDEFDPRFFNISPREAITIDPQERLFLQMAWLAIEDAGYTRETLQIPRPDNLPAQVGVYAGVMYGEYNLSGILASIANRVSYALNLHGPSMTVDTMCSSSLTAIHLACQDLKSGRTDLAIAGGVNVSIDPSKYHMLSAGQFISSDGHCQSFGEGGDGYIPGEGVGAVVLMRLSKAVEEGHHIYGVIKGSAVNHGGKTNGYTVPNPLAQAASITTALAEAKVDPRHISYVEAHGTGTKLGDPIEIAALSKAYYSTRGNTDACGGKAFQYCAIGSAKSNIGHCESAAGIAGLSKVLLQMQHRQIVPSLHSARLNPHIDFEQSPFVVNQTLREWASPVIDGQSVPRIAGLSSFGAGGSNAHMIIEEYSPAVKSKHSRPLASVSTQVEQMIVLSARTADQLREKARDLLDFIHADRQESEAPVSAPSADTLKAIDLEAMAYTLQIGREAMDERLGFIADSLARVSEKLQAYLRGDEDIEGFYSGQVKANRENMVVINRDDDMKEAIDKWIVRKKFSNLLEMWVKGLNLDWNKLYPHSRPGRISLPGYPFARERYWNKERKSVVQQASSAGDVGDQKLHPLLHRNTSTIHQHSYNAVFTGDEPLVGGHRILHGDNNESPVVPVASMLEMVRAAVDSAVADADAARPRGLVMELHNIQWADPILVSANKQVGVALFPVAKDSVDFEVFSHEPGWQTSWEDVVHCQGAVRLTDRLAAAKVNLARLKAQMQRGRLNAEALYDSLGKAGVRYGQALRTVVAVEFGEGQLLAELQLDDSDGKSLYGAGRDTLALHPAIVDGAMQAASSLLHSGSFPSLPLATESIRLYSACQPRMLAWVRYSREPEVRHTDSDDIIRVDIDLLDEEGRPCAQIRGLSYEQEARGKPQSRTPVSTTSPVEAESGPANRILINRPEVQVFTALVLEKPTGILLGKATDFMSAKPRTAARPAVILSDPSSVSKHHK